VNQALQAWKRRRRNLCVYIFVFIFPYGLTSSYFLFARLNELWKFQVELDPSLAEAGDGDGDGAAGKYNPHQIISFTVFLSLSLFSWTHRRGVYPCIRERKRTVCTPQTLGTPTPQL
jgi:hypothetical protein